MTARDDRLRELAQEATPGPWEADEPATTWRARDGHVRTTHPDFEDCADEIAETLSNDDAQFIAAASPDVLLGLLDRLAAVEAERDRLAAVVERVEAVTDDCAAVSTAEPGGEVGTGAGEGATGQDAGTEWVTRSADCPEAPAQAHLPAVEKETDRG